MSAHKVIIVLEVLIFAILVLFVVTNEREPKTNYGSSSSRRNIINAMRRQ